MRIAIHAGHNPDGKIAHGAVGFGKESTLAREVVAYMKDYLNVFFNDVDVFVATCNDGINSTDVLKKICNATNRIHCLDLSVSIHFNASASPTANGVEVWAYTGNSRMHDLSSVVCKELEKYGYKNRGVKESRKLYVLRKIKCDSILIECAFVTNKKDMAMFDSRQVAKRIVKGIVKYYGKDF